MDVFTNCIKLLNRPELYIRPQVDLHKEWLTKLKHCYDFMKAEEVVHNLTCDQKLLLQLHILDIDIEQLWQQIELQNRCLVTTSKDINSLDISNLCIRVAKLSNLVKHGVICEYEDGFSDTDSDESNSPHINNLEADAELTDSQSVEENEKADEEENDDEFLHFDKHDLSDSDTDLKFGEIALKESDDDSFLSEDKQQTEDSQTQYQSEDNRTFERTELDTKFFSLRESEWVADNDLIGEEHNVDLQDVDFMKDDENLEIEDPKYGDFFGPLESDENVTPTTNSLNRTANKLNSSQENFHLHLIGKPDTENISSFEKEQEKILNAIKNAEEWNMSQKPWFLKGEVQNNERPENAALEEYLDYDISVRQKPDITEGTSAYIEKIILGRLYSKTFDDVERKAKKELDPFQYRKRLTLDQEKSKKSLSKIYEEEYMKSNQRSQSAQSDQHGLPEHNEIKTLMESLFHTMDLLSSFSLTQKRKVADVKIVSNFPGITVEETVPVTLNDSALLAPEEVFAPQKGELVGKSEETSTDRKSHRRQKKAQQKVKAKLCEATLRKKLKKASKSGSPDAKASLKVVEKAVKAGKIKMLNKSGNGKKLKSSEAFFDLLQEGTRVRSQNDKN